ncbi:hypothetical protein J8I87_33915 [Paraburkholderia sp. LEh10]|uniref:hypothetical protein n=1 Tax=Paraburkholderia sp. LEh10 TaxID=2821353 RepID=UPI001AE1223A|nr:hypothetical protein [Paraburkholderia sp. LEh10]MBP0594572.1 hypothetical protein [Paraburkholderia sp. LEh10]
MFSELMVAMAGRLLRRAHRANQRRCCLVMKVGKRAPMQLLVMARVSLFSIQR